MMRVKLEKAVFTMTLFRGYSLEWFNNFLDKDLVIKK